MLGPKKSRYAMRTRGKPLGRRAGAGNKGVELCFCTVSTRGAYLVV